MGEFTRKRASALVKQVPYHHSLCGGGRAGTVRASEVELAAAFGKPYDPSAGNDGKVTKIWAFETPRGVAMLRDYWWNAADEWSIGSESRKAAKWLKRHVAAKLADLSAGVV